MRNDGKERGDGPPGKRIRYGPNPNADGDTQPPMLTFKAFLQNQDDNISDEDASAKYTEYKLEFRRQQLNDFFNAHKEEEWFMWKYHPQVSNRRKAELRAAVHKRAEVFIKFLHSGKIDSISLDTEHSNSVEKLLDLVVINLEGVSEHNASQNNEDLNQSKNENSKSEMRCKEDENSKVENDGSPQKDDEWIIIDHVGVDEEDSNTKSTDNSDIQFSERKITLADLTSDKSNSTDELKNHEDSLGTPDGASSNSDPPHKTRSVFLRNISPRITKSDIEEVCKKYPGFLRIWLSDIQPEQHWCRRGFVTFRRNVNIKKICWNLTNVKIKDSEWQVGVNHDLSRRTRSVSGFHHFKAVVFSDIKLAVRIIQELDSRVGLWRSSQEVTSFELQNPIFKGITEYIVEEASAESEELLGKQAGSDDCCTCSTDTMKALDKLLLYLRIVHSVDYYNASQYMAEDEMPNRCGIIHLRGLLPPQQASEKDLEEFIQMNKKKLEPLYTPLPVVPDSELIPLGLRSEETEVEKFITSNTQELAKDKWLCPLSGKKFKAPEFIRKHMLNKYTKEFEDIKKEVDYFNNYLRDPRRPVLPEHPGFLTSRKDPEINYPCQFGVGFRRGFGFGPFAGHGFFRGRGGMMGRGRGMDFRPVVQYRDLDAPCEPDEVV